MNDLFARMGVAAAILVLLAIVPGGAQDKRAADSATQPEIVSLLGVKHYAKADEKGEIAQATARVAGDPNNVDLLKALGRVQSAHWRYHDAIATYTRALKIAPADASLYRHRGHRYISIRRFAPAVDDLKRAAQLNDADFDIWYHLGLAHYLRGELAEARTAYEKCYALALKRSADAKAGADGNDDSLIAVSDWLYMTLRRLDRPADAARILDRITAESKVRENKSYFKRILFYKGLTKEDDLVNVKVANDSEVATLGYGLGNWHLYNGNRTRADECFRRVVAGKFWPAFGFIAAEVELANAKKP